MLRSAAVKSSSIKEMMSSSKSIQALFTTVLEAKIHSQRYKLVSTLFHKWLDSEDVGPELFTVINLLIKLVSLCGSRFMRICGTEGKAHDNEDDEKSAVILREAFSAFVRRADIFPGRELANLPTRSLLLALVQIASSNMSDFSSILASPLNPGRDSDSDRPTVTIESDHNYKSNEDWVKECSIPGAAGLEIRFDPRTRTESGRDTVTIWADPEKSKRLAGPYSGLEGSTGKWPGVGVTLPVVLKGVHTCWVGFQSGGSVNCKFSFVCIKLFKIRFHYH